MDAVTDRIWPAGLTRVPYWVYTDADVLAREQKRIFEGPVWNFLCLEIDLPNPGDYRTTFVGTMPVVVVRAEDGELAAFENRCAHRGALICLDDGGNVKDFQCVYHSWRYDLRGNLRSIAFRRGVNGKGGMPADFDMTQHGPRKLRVTTFCGMVFGTLSPRRARIRRPGSAPRSSAASAACSATASWRSSAASPRRCRTTGSSISRTCATPITPACCICSSPPSASPA